jgi:hypothetical protein
MIQPQRFRKLPECETCLLYTDDMMQMCRLHPRGVTTASCLDYREDPSAARNWAEFLGFALEEQEQPKVLGHEESGFEESGYEESGH